MRLPMMKKLTICIVIIALAAASLLVFVPDAFAELTAKANHDNINIGIGYHGSTVSVSGTCDPNVDFIITISSNDENSETLSRQDRVAGTVWMNVEKIEFAKTPAFYFIRSSKPLDELLGPEAQTGRGIGYKALATNAELSPTPDDAKKEAIFNEFIKYKEAGGIFSQSTGSIDVTPGDNGQSKYFTIFDWPYKAPPGDYTVNVYETRDGQIVDSAQSAVKVEEGGVVKTLDDMSTQNAALYGSAAVLVALAAGFGVGLVFKGGGAH